jgi:hypothetical protein
MNMINIMEFKNQTQQNAKLKIKGLIIEMQI